MPHPVEIYTKRYCPSCQRAKELLRIKGIPVREYAVDDDLGRAAELAQRSGGAAVPGIFVAGRWVGGCPELFDLDESGELDRLLTLLRE